jgi:aminoglycoside/choline kinase family phosphotransferase
LIIKDKIKTLEHLFAGFYGQKPDIICPMPLSGSSRQYFRLSKNNFSAIGAYNYDISENKAFIAMSNHFKMAGLNVPEIYSINDDYDCYITEDLGDNILFNLITEHSKLHGFNDVIFELYKSVIDNLLLFQFKGHMQFDYSVCYPVNEFNKQSILWDLNYFKYFFLKLSGINFDELKLDKDFEKLSLFLDAAQRNCFMYRDFQTRNIILKDNKLYFIDYQGGRKGTIYYDLASLLFQAKINMPVNAKEKLIEYYLSKLIGYQYINNDEFYRYFYAFALLRILQTLGAYGYRGYYEHKGHFIQSIPFAVANAINIFKSEYLSDKADYINELLDKYYFENDLISNEKIINKLKVTVTSFSYKSQQPIDYYGNGGGFVFDCRALPNPARIDALKHLTGKDKEVIEYLEKEVEVKRFIENCEKIISQSIEKYIERGFTNLMVSFGCTGGQHRSVYCAEKLAEIINSKYQIIVEVKHNELK